VRYTESDIELISSLASTPICEETPTLDDQLRHSVAWRPSAAVVQCTSASVACHASNVCFAGGDKQGDLGRQRSLSAAVLPAAQRQRPPLRRCTTITGNENTSLNRRLSFAGFFSGFHSSPSPSQTPKATATDTAKRDKLSKLRGEGKLKSLRLPFLSRRSSSRGTPTATATTTPSAESEIANLPPFLLPPQHSKPYPESPSRQSSVSTASGRKIRPASLHLLPEITPSTPLSVNLHTLASPQSHTTASSSSRLDTTPPSSLASLPDSLCHQAQSHHSVRSSARERKIVHSSSRDCIAEKPPSTVDVLRASEVELQDRDGATVHFGDALRKDGIGQNMVLFVPDLESLQSQQYLQSIIDEVPSYLTLRRAGIKLIVVGTGDIAQSSTAAFFPHSIYTDSTYTLFRKFGVTRQDLSETDAIPDVKQKRLSAVVRKVLKWSEALDTPRSRSPDAEQPLDKADLLGGEFILSRGIQPIFTHRLHGDDTVRTPFPSLLHAAGYQHPYTSSPSILSPRQDDREITCILEDEDGADAMTEELDSSLASDAGDQDANGDNVQASISENGHTASYRIDNMTTKNTTSRRASRPAVRLGRRWSMPVGACAEHRLAGQGARWDSEAGEGWAHQVAHGPSRSFSSSLNKPYYPNFS